MSDFSDVLDTLIPLVGDVLVDKAKNEITKLSEDADDPTKQIVFALMAEAVGELGEDGLDIAEAEIKRLLNGRTPDLDWASPRTASDAVALLQNAERGRKKKAKTAITKAGKVFGVIGALFFKAAVSGALNK
jgi:hypothetical protein